MSEAKQTTLLDERAATIIRQQARIAELEHAQYNWSTCKQCGQYIAQLKEQCAEIDKLTKERDELRIKLVEANEEWNADGERLMRAVDALGAATKERDELRAELEKLRSYHRENYEKWGAGLGIIKEASDE